MTFSAEHCERAGDEDIEQIPRVFGAEVSGQKLYEYARRVSKCREARPITVYELLFIRHEGNELELEVHAKGTYSYHYC